MKPYFIGLMSGTSLDGTDGVLVRFSPSSESLQVLAHAHRPFSEDLRQQVLQLNEPSDNELHRAALCANALSLNYAAVVQALLLKSQVSADQVQAIGCHGQTVRHRPREFDGLGYTVQLNNPARLAELCGMDVVADFRTRDVAAGGQGAPLVPAFHRAVFGQQGQSVAVVNIGGMSNLTAIGPLVSYQGSNVACSLALKPDGVVAPRRHSPSYDSSSRLASGLDGGAIKRHLSPDTTPGDTLGFDCGPGNVLLDTWCKRHTEQAFDRDGAWAASGQPINALLDQLLDEPFFRQPPPKSTGRDLFNQRWLEAKLSGFTAHTPQDIQATLAELTAASCAQAILDHTAPGRQVLICGGGAFNTDLMQRISRRLGGPVASTAAKGLPADQVESAAFAWLAKACVLRQSGNLVSATGALGPRVLGAIYPA